jgi:signal transduction histidine kinase
MSRDLWKWYLWHDYERIATSRCLRSSILEILKAHWSGNLILAWERCRPFTRKAAFDGLGINEKEIIATECELLTAKLGLPLCTVHWQNHHWVPQLLCAYARYTYYFWIDHDISWQYLWKFCFQAVRGRSSAVFCAMFLLVHMQAIQAGGRIASFLAKIVVSWILYLRRHNVGLPPIAYRIVIAAYPYTLFMLGKPLAVKDYVEKNGHLVSPDHYYQTVFQISCFYAFAYAGDVVRTEIFASRFKALHREGKLARYQAITELLPMLPLGLRGYGFVVESKFDRVLREHNDDINDPVVNFQFYRAAAVIDLSLHRFDDSIIHIQKAIKYRKMSGSFQAWSKVDARILYLAQNRTTFDPQKSRLLGINVAFESAHGLSRFFLLLNAELPRFCANPELFVNYVASYLKNHVGECQVSIASLVTNRDIFEKVCIKVRQKYIIIEADKERLPYVSGIIETLSPAVFAMDATIADMESLSRNLEESSRLAAIARTTQTIAHDVRRPFSQIKMGIEVLKQKEMPAESRQFVEYLGSKVDRSCHLVESMLDDILHIGRSYNLATSTLAVKDLLKGAIELVFDESQIDQSRYQFIGPEMLFIAGDDRYLTRAFTNLVVNAVEAMGADGSLFVLVRNRKFSDGDMVEVRVRNTHSYIAQEDLDKIFEPFYTRGKSSGTGLGLAIVKQIIDAHGAKISCVSSEIHGTEFIMLFERVEPAVPTGQEQVATNYDNFSITPPSF